MGQNKLSLKLKQKSDLIGIAILGVGVIALLVVGYMVYLKFSPPSSEGNNIAQDDIEDFKRSGRAPNRAAGEKPVSEKGKYKRQKSISEKELSGAWRTNLEKEQALLEIGDGKYRLVLIYNRKPKIRYYSNGDYKIQDDIIILTPDLNSSSPESDVARYSVLTRTDMPVMASKYKGKLIWQEPPSDIDMYVPPRHPILDRDEDKIVVWDVLE